MANCEYCKCEMETEQQCTQPTKILLNGQLWDRNTEYYDVNNRCHDCGILNVPGHLHHLGCDIERCPCCKGQLISCSCIHGPLRLSADQIKHDKQNPELSDVTERDLRRMCGYVSGLNEAKNNAMIGQVDKTIEELDRMMTNMLLDIKVLKEYLE